MPGNSDLRRSGPAPDEREPSGSLQSTGWVVPPWKMQPLSARRCLLRNPLNGAAAELDSGEYAVLTACEGCRSLEEHEALAATRLNAPMEHRPAIRELLALSAQKGLLMPLPDLVARFGAPPARAPRSIVHAVVRTADRPKLLERLLASAEALESRTGFRRRWIVIDDSRDVDNERANRGALERCRKLDSEHVDHSATASLVGTLRAEFPALAGPIEWLLGAGRQEQTTAGVAINQALLRLAGSVFVNFDDDAIIDPRRPALAERGFAVSDAADEFVWYAAATDMWADCPSIDMDPIAAHERWLGLPLAEAWQRAKHEAGPLATVAIDPAQLERFAPDARVLFTHNDSCGDPGSSMLPFQLFALPPRSRQWLASHPGAARSPSRIGWRGQTRLRLAPQRDLTFTTMVGVDNSRLLPPTARNHRSQDLLLGLVARRMYPSSWVVDLPFALPHLRIPAKDWLGSGGSFRQEPLHVVYSYLEERSRGLNASSAEQRLATMGTQLLDLASAEEHRLREALLQHAIEFGSRALFSIQEQLDDAALPATWKSTLSPWLHSPALVSESAAERALDSALVRALLEAYGNAMHAWPRLWSFCAERRR